MFSKITFLWCTKCVYQVYQEKGLRIEWNFSPHWIMMLNIVVLMVYFKWFMSWVSNLNMTHSLSRQTISKTCGDFKRYKPVSVKLIWITEWKTIKSAAVYKLFIKDYSLKQITHTVQRDILKPSFQNTCIIMFWFDGYLSSFFFTYWNFSNNVIYKCTSMLTKSCTSGLMRNFNCGKVYM